MSDLLPEERLLEREELAPHYTVPPHLSLESAEHGGGGFYLYDFFLKVGIESHVVLYIDSAKWCHGSIAPTNAKIRRYGCALDNHTHTLKRAATQMASTSLVPPGPWPVSKKSKDAK